ncbi:cytochrome b [Halioxenophilus sp. WMMB6]|uniref:cytochrome b n=1 Tax=Halioxenophilus sp. WMMB6 TaxID=3073815 RepID=UPI00295F5A5A|nr:cytochrome b/b6 domain-containing protein [Halioxenophilus sp. WMMB6]
MATDLAKYDVTSRWLHWLHASVILWATVSGLTVSLGHVSKSLEQAIGGFNVSITSLLIPFFAWRLLNRSVSQKPGYGQALSTAEVWLARAMHWALYGLTCVVLVSGVMRMDAPFSIFHLLLVPNLVASPTVIEVFDQLHIISTRLLALCVLVHLLAVFKHQLRGTNILRRMI